MENKIISLASKRTGNYQPEKPDDGTEGTVVSFSAKGEKPNGTVADPIAVCMEFRDPMVEAVGLKWFDTYMSSPADIGSLRHYQEMSGARDALRWMDGSTVFFKQLVKLENHARYKLKRKEDESRYGRSDHIGDYDWSGLGIDMSDHGGALGYLAPMWIIALFNKREALKSQLAQCAQALEAMIVHPVAPVCLPQIYEIDNRREAKVNLDPTEICTSEPVLERLAHLPTSAILEKIRSNLAYIRASHTNYAQPMAYLDRVYERKNVDVNGIEGLDHRQRGDRREILKAGLRYGTVALMRICGARLGTKKDAQETPDAYVERLKKANAAYEAASRRTQSRKNTLEHAQEKKRTRGRELAKDKRGKKTLQADFMRSNYAALLEAENRTGLTVTLPTLRMPTL